MTNASSLVGSRLTRRINAGFLWASLVVAVGGGVLTLVLGGGGVINDLRTGSAWLNVVANKPVPTAALGGAHPIAHGTYDTALLHVSHLGVEALGFAVTSEVAGTVVAATLWLLVAFLAWRLLHGRPLRKSLSTIVSIGGAVLVIGGMVQAGAEAIAPALAARQLNSASHSHFWPLAGRFDGSLMGVGFALLVIALVFEYGARLQKDTEGLV